MTYNDTEQAKQRATLLHALKGNKCCDVTFVIGINEHKKSFQANRLFLSLISPVFKAMLYGEMQESKQNAEIEINDIHPDAFEAVLNYAYCNDPKLSPSNIIGVYVIADKYQISSLLQLCNKYFSSSLNIRNICILLSTSVAMKLDTYITKCINAIKLQFNVHAKQIVESKGFLSMNIDSMKLFLVIDELIIKEEDLWDALIKWAKNKKPQQYDNDFNGTPPPNKKQKLNNGNSNSNIENKNNYEIKILKNICPFIRFGLMNGNYFVRNVRPLNCLTAEEMTDILCYIQCNDGTCGKFSVKPRIASWIFKSNPNVIVSNKGLTVNQTVSATGSTILFGDFMTTGFRVVELTLNRNGGYGGLCVVGKQFKTWQGFQRNTDWLYVNNNSELFGNSEWDNKVTSKTNFKINVNDILSIMIDMDNYKGEFKNKTSQQYIKFNLPKRPCGIAIMLDDCQFTVTKQIVDKSQY